jgi:hypothetical protein
MSALGHKRTFRDTAAMSALAPKADISWRQSNVCWISDATALEPEPIESIFT